jgi:hypothetical protein
MSANSEVSFDVIMLVILAVEMLKFVVILAKFYIFFLLLCFMISSVVI